MNELLHFLLGALSVLMVALHWKLLSDHDSEMRKIMEEDARFARAMSVRYCKLMEGLVKAELDKEVG